MDVSYFGLRERPFASSPDCRFIFLGAKQQKGLAHLLQGVRERGGLVLPTGETGTGKTTLCRLLLSRSRSASTWRSSSTRCTRPRSFSERSATSWG